VERADEDAVADHDLRAVAEARPRTRHGLAGPIQDPENRGPREGAEDQQDADRVEDGELALEERCAGIALLDRRLVQRRRAANRGGDPSADQGQAIVRPAARGLVRDPGPMERGPQEVAARIAREDAPGPVPAVSCRREPDDEDPTVRVTETRERPAPIRLIAVPRDLLASDELAPRDEARAAPALDDLALELGQG